VIFDILQDEALCDSLEIFSNIKEKIDLEMPLKQFPYTLYKPGEKPDAGAEFLLGVSGAKNKIPVFNYFKKEFQIERETYFKLIHGSAYIADSSQVGRGCIIEQNVTISSQTSLGFAVSAKRAVSIGHHCKIGDFVDINPGVIISGKVNVGNGTLLGSGCIINDGVKIGENCIIGSGSVVTKDIPSNVVAFGNPCKVVRENQVIKTKT
jgi:sugar O-acyltransferase (sialic acid O-acetyltransferase NeuD family)